MTGENINPLKYREISARTRRPIAGRGSGPKPAPAPSRLQPSLSACASGGAAVVAESGGERAGAGLEGGAVFSRNNNLSLSNKRGRSERSGRAALRTLANKCWRNKILLPNNIRGRSLLLLNSAALCSVTIPAKLWPPPSSNLAPRDLLTAHRRESLLHRPSSANFRLRFSNNVSFVFAFRIHDRILTIYIYI